MKQLDYQKCTNVEILQARIAELEEILFNPTDPRVFNLTNQEQRVCTILANSKTVVTKDKLYISLYNGWHEVQMKIIVVFICKIRTKLPETVKIETIWGRGYFMPPESRETWKQYLDAARSTGN